jgi:hypothetical protein
VENEPTRRPPLYVTDALSHLAVATDRRLPQSLFEMLMGKGWSREIALRAIQALERRGWIVLHSGVIHITDTGHAAATAGIGVAKTRKRIPNAGTLNRAAATRMPRGLF